METGLIGLRRLGANLARRLPRKNHRVVACNWTAAKTDEIDAPGASGAYTISELIEKLYTPRVVWVMVTAG